MNEARPAALLPVVSAPSRARGATATATVRSTAESGGEPAPGRDLGAASVSAARHPASIEGFLSVGGGSPIRADDGPGAEVAGAPDRRSDERFAQAGIARVRDRLR